MIRIATLALVLCAIPTFAHAQSFRVIVPVRSPGFAPTPPVVVAPPVVVQRPVIVTPAPIFVNPVVPVVATYPVQPVCYEVFVRNGAFGFWESAGTFHSATQADVFASRMELRGYDVRVRAR